MIQNNRKMIVTIGLFGSLLSVFLGYWVAGGIGYAQSNNSSFLAGFNLVLEHPFAAYFNNYTPILMLLFFLAFETIFLVIQISSKSKSSRSDHSNEYGDTEEMKKVLQSPKPDISDVDDDLQAVLRDKIADMQTVKTGEPQNDVETIIPTDNWIDNDSLDGSPEDILKEDAGDVKNDENSGDGEHRQEMLSDVIAMELLNNNEYTLDQVMAMLDLYQYMDVTTDLLRRMFKPSMSADTIRKYIQMFYE